MKTVLHICKFYEPTQGGIETVSRYLAEGLTDYRNVVVCFAEDNNTCKDVVRGVEVYRTGVQCVFMSQPISIGYYKLIKQLLCQYTPDVVLLHAPNPLVYPIVLSLTKNSNIKIVVLWHSDILSKGLAYTFVRPFETRLLKKANLILATSPNYIDRSVISKYREKVEVLQNGIIESQFQMQVGDDQRLQTIRDLYRNKKVVFAFGRHVPYKGLEYLIKAESKIATDCVILIAGSGPITEQLKEQTVGKSRIRFLGRLSEIDLRCYLHMADVFAFPSINKAEAFGIALAEAMYCNCTPVCFTLDGSGVNWVSINGETGLQVPLQDTTEFAKAIDMLLGNKGYRDQLASAARSRVLKLFTSDKAVDKCRIILSKILNEKES